jgi:regulator of replication initiation timing
MNEGIIKNIIDLYSNPIFKSSFLEFSTIMQHEGVDAAKKFWDMNPKKNTLSDNTTEIFEQMISFYSNLGFVPKAKYDEVVKENEKLKKENEFLEKTMKELNLKVFNEGSLKIQEAWREITDKQMEMAKDISKNFFDLFKQSGKK